MRAIVYDTTNPREYRATADTRETQNYSVQLDSENGTALIHVRDSMQQQKSTLILNRWEIEYIVKRLTQVEKLLYAVEE